MLPQLVPALPLALIVPVCLASMVLLAAQLRFYGDGLTRLALFAVWLRYVMSALHPFTYPPIAGGLSLNALASCAVVGVLLLNLDRRALLLKHLAPIYSLIVVVCISGWLNGQLPGAANTTIKFMYLIALSLALYYGFVRHGVQKMVKGMAIAFIVPIVLQWLSIALGLGKATETDGSISYIGGYNHEAAFSITLLTFITVLVFLNQGRMTRRLVYLFIGIVGLIIANYRTSILAIIPPIATFLSVVVIGSFVVRQRPLAILACGLFMVISGLMLVALVGDRFADIGVSIAKGASLVKPPIYFTLDEQKLFSARAYIWSHYIHGWMSGSYANFLIGFGPDAWVGRFSKYAHNTLVSYLFEFGLVGLMVLCVFFWRSFQVASLILGPLRPVCISALTGFVLLNMATMPLWLIEGNVLLAIILSSTWYAAQRSGAASKASVYSPGLVAQLPARLTAPPSRP